MPRTEVTGRQIKDKSVSLSDDVVDILPVANGGTGVQTLPSGSVLVGNNTGAVQVVYPGTTGNVLTSNGSTWTSAAPTAVGDVTTNTSTSVDNEVVLFNGTTGKALKRATETGYAYLTSGVLSSVTSIPQSAIASLTTDLAGKVNTSAVGAADGVASLNSSGQVPSAQLPSYVDDVLEYASVAAFPGTGETGKIYVSLNTNKIYRWSGSAYIEISPSPGSTDAVTEGSTNLYFTNARADARITAATGTSVQAYSANLAGFAGKTAPSGAVVGTTDIQTLTNKTLTAPAISSPTGLSKSDVGLGNVDNTSDASKPISTATQTALDGKLSTTGTAAQATKLATPRTFVTNLSGTSSASFDGTGNATLGVTGSLPIGSLSATGTPSSTTFLRGDSTWATMPATASFVQTIGDGSATSITVTHNLNTRNVVVSVKRSSNYTEVECDVAATTVNTATLTFATAPALNEFFITVISDGSITSSNVLVSPVTTNSGNSLILPTTNDTLVARNTVDALTNKDLTSATNTFPAFLRRVVTGITTSDTLAAAANTDYVYLPYSGDANYASVTSLLHMNLTPGYDVSQGGVIWTAGGNAALSSAQSKFGGSSLALDGSGDYLYGNAGTPMTFGTGDFTIEMWAYLNSPLTDTVFFDWRPATTNGAYPEVGLTASTGFISYYVSAATRIQGATAVTAGTWHHIALSRVSSVTRLFLNGVQQGSNYSDTSNYAVGTNRPLFGANGFTISQNNMNGYIDEVRITKGVGRYTANFTPSTTAFPDLPTLTLPTAVGNNNQYTIKNISGYNVSVNTTSSQYVDGSVGTQTVANNGILRVISDQTGWRTV